MKKSIKNITTPFGLYLGAILTLLTITAYLAQIDLFVTAWFGLIIYGISVALGIVSVIKAKQYFNSYVTFREAFSAYFICILIGLGIYTLVTYLLFNFIDFEASEYLKEKSLEKNIEILKSINTPKEKIAESVNSFKTTNLFSFSNAFKSLIVAYLLPLSIIGLLVAAALKKSDPEAK